jgi:Ca2+-binding EF-hand superfamily protein
LTSAAAAGEVGTVDFESFFTMMSNRQEQELRGVFSYFDHDFR